MSLFLDQEDYLHVAFTTGSYFEATGTHYWHASIIWHWTEQFPDEFVMIHNAFDDYWWNYTDCGAWNVKAQRPSLGQDPQTGHLYCAYQVYDVDTTALSAAGWPSGEIYVSVSTDGGMNWALGTNVTQTVTPTDAPPGQCTSEICPSMANLVDGHCHILYCSDRDAGAVVQTEGTWTLNNMIYHDIPVDLIPTTPLVQQNVPFHIDQPPFGPFIAINAASGTVFPAEGDTLSYNVVGWNDQPYSVTTDVWVDVTLPDGSIRGPVCGPLYNVLLNSAYNDTSWSIIVPRDLVIPGFAPAGTYLLNGYLGDYDPISPTIEAENHLYFYKLTQPEGGPWIGGGAGWIEEQYTSVENASAAFVTCFNHPNPFNQSTTFSFALPEATQVKLIVYNLQGQAVATLIDGIRDAGSHDITFDATQFASGIYLYRFTAGEQTIDGKMILIK